MDRYNRVDNTTPVVSELKNKKLKVPRSPFNLQHENIFQMPFGLIVPVNLTRALPNTSYKLNIDALISSRNPLVRTPYTGARVYFKTYFCKDSDLWEGAPNQKTRGRTGKLGLNLPHVKLDYDDGTNTLNCVTPLSLAEMLGVPCQYYDDENNLTSYVPTPHSREGDEETPVEHVHTVNAESPNVNALPFVMYQKICRKLMNSNVLQENESWYPENELDFILGYDAEEVNILDRNNPLLTDTEYMALDHSADGPCAVPQNVNDGTSPVDLLALHYCQFKGDYFTTGNPFADLLRGDTPVINLSLIAKEGADATFDSVVKFAKGTVSDVDFHEFYEFDDAARGTGVSQKKLNLSAGTTPQDYFDLYGSIKYTAAFPPPKTYRERMTASVTTDVSQITERIMSAAVSMNDLRALQTYTLMKERMALTDGSYNQLIESMYNTNPELDTHEPIYIGGTYQDIIYDEVVSTASTSDGELGQRSSNGKSAGSGACGKFFAKDYGYFMTIMYIVQDTIYTQGIDRILTDLSYDDVYFPMLENLSPMPIHNRELYLSGDADTDDLPFNYQERYSFMKSKRNVCHGLCALGPELALFDNALVQKRRFDSTPSFNNSFLTMSPQNVDMSIFSRYDEPPFDVCLNIKEDWVAPLSYITMPGSLEMAS